jgi:hypothetical protein
MSEQKASCGVTPCGIDDESFVFVSYAHMDSEKVFSIIESVAASGFAIWYDKGINISSTWTDEIATAIMNCKVFVVFITRESVASAYVRSEIEFALNNKIKIIPVYLDGMEILPPGLALGLNSTQGIADVEDPEQIAARIRDALDYNDVTRRDPDAAAEPVRAKDKSPRRGGGRKSRKPVLAAITAVALFFIWSLFHGYSIRIDKTEYSPAEPIFASLSGVTRKMIDGGAVVGVCKAGAPHGEYISYEFIESGKTGVKLRAPLNPGKYEIRGYSDGNVLNRRTLSGSVKFTVAGNSMGAFSVTTDKRRYAPSENIAVKVSGVPKYMIDDGAVVSLCDVNAKPDEFITYVFIGDRDAEFVFYAPNRAGEYEMRGFANMGYRAESSMTARAPFIVAD